MIRISDQLTRVSNWRPHGALLLRTEPDLRNDGGLELDPRTRTAGFLNRKQIFVWAAIILASHQLEDLLNRAPGPALRNVIYAVASANLFQCIAWYATVRLLLQSDAAKRGRTIDFVISTILCLVLVLPSTRVVWVAGLGMGLYWWVFSSGDRYLRAAGIVLSALAIQQFWSHVLFNLLAPELLAIETAIVGAMVAVFHPGTIWHENVITGSDGYGIVLYTGCSSFENICIALLCWTTIARLKSPSWKAGELAGATAVGVLLVCLNWGRLILMALNLNLYKFWHDGPGNQIFEVAASLMVVSLCLRLTKMAEVDA